MALFITPLLTIVPFFWALKAVASSLKNWIMVLGFWVSKRILAFPSRMGAIFFAKRLARRITAASAPTSCGKYSYATPNSTSLVTSETIRRIAGLDLTGVPYKSSPQAMTDLMGGSVQMYVTDVGSGMGMIKGGQVRVLGVTTQEPLSSLPQIPPIAREVPGFDLTSWNGVFGPAGMSKAVVDKLNTELLAALSDPEVKESLKKLGFETWPSKTSEEFAKYVSDQLAHWGTLIKQAGIKPE